jgi:membrane protein DedA with SNARE-associated domain
MFATILIVALVVVGFALSLYVKRFAESPALFFIQLVCAIYLIAEAIKAWMNEDRVFGHTLVALVSLVVLGTFLWRRVKSGRAE